MYEASDVLQEERVHHMNALTKGLTQASHEVPHLDPVIDVLHHSFRTALKNVSSRLGLMSMDVSSHVVDDNAFLFNLRDHRKLIRNRHTGRTEHAAQHSHAHRPLLRVYARKASVFSRIRRLSRRLTATATAAKPVEILQYLVDLEKNAMAAPMACPEQCRFLATVFQELLAHGFLPEAVSAHQGHFDQSDAEQAVGHRTWAGPDTYQVMLANRDIEVFFNVRPRGLYEFGEMPEMNHYVEERQTAVA